MKLLGNDDASIEVPVTLVFGVSDLAFPSENILRLVLVEVLVDDDVVVVVELLGHGIFRSGCITILLAFAS
jgi:hypothetical protein